MTYYVGVTWREKGVANLSIDSWANGMTMMMMMIGPNDANQKFISSGKKVIFFPVFN
jgi:hypothetical protein